MESMMSGLRWRKQSGLKAIQTKIGKVAEIEMKAEEDDNGYGEEPLSPSARMFHQPNFNVHVIAVMGSKCTIQPQLVKQNLVHTLLKHPRFTSVLVEDEKDKGEMKWVLTKVELDDHIVIPKVEEDNNNLLLRESGDKFVEDYIQKLSKTSLPKSRPLWDLHLLNLKTSDAEAVGVLRIHHSLGDGASLISLLLACTRQTAHPHKLPTIPTKKRRPPRPAAAAASRMWPAACLVSLWCFLTLMWNSFVDVFMFVATALFFKDTNTPIKATTGSHLHPRRVVYRTVSLDDFKLIKNAMNMTINDVALGVVQAGLSTYLNKRYGDHDKEDDGEMEKTKHLPDNIRLRSTLLINLRPSAGIQELGEMMEKESEAKWGNCIGYVILPFRIELKENPLDYMRDAKSTIDRKKRSLEALYTFYIAQFVLKLFGIKAASCLSHRVIEHTTMCFSNLVGPQEEIGFCGHPMAYLAPSSYGQPHALMINFQSYINKMTMVLSVDENVIPNPHQLLDDLEMSLKLIKDATLANSLVL
ncbi:PREDICTED: O-acyltransferase WSD1-like isoform X2 [Ipomoea nil]|uniref:O-acyltransferase WSD1-like isoform X2 n=1 Tax=Ipomoea nil TaxID=35883 RepID=UPI000901705C|nr:PREDICTED: O-acyltransferase WSD1-like isoform X2 [Ipomoea nil]